MKVKTRSIFDVYDVSIEASHDVVSSVLPLTRALKRTCEHLDVLNEAWVNDSQVRRQMESAELQSQADALANGTSTAD